MVGGVQLERAHRPRRPDRKPGLDLTPPAPAKYRASSIRALGRCAYLLVKSISLRSKPMDIVRILIAILLPPLGVFLQVGLGGQFWINILLTLLGYIPGIVHAVWVIAKH